MLLYLYLHLYLYTLKKTHFIRRKLKRCNPLINNIFDIKKSRRPKGTTIWFLLGGGGGGQEDLSEPENFFRRPFGPDYFFKPSGAHFFKPEGVGGGGGRHPCSYITITRDFFFFFFKEHNIPFNNAKSHLKQFTECEMQILDCESRFRTVKGRFVKCENRVWRAKALPKASRRIFFPWNHSRIFLGGGGGWDFLPPPHKNQMVAP